MSLQRKSASTAKHSVTRQCPTCQQVLRECQELQCSHTLCLECIKSHSGRKGVVCCPLCGRWTALPPGGVTSFSKPQVATHKTAPLTTARQTTGRQQSRSGLKDVQSSSHQAQMDGMNQAGLLQQLELCAATLENEMSKLKQTEQKALEDLSQAARDIDIQAAKLRHLVTQQEEKMLKQLDSIQQEISMNFKQRKQDIAFQQEKLSNIRHQLLHHNACDVSEDVVDSTDSVGLANIREDVTGSADDAGLSNYIAELYQKFHFPTSWHYRLQEIKGSTVPAISLIGHIAWHTDTDRTCEQCSHQLPLLRQKLKFKVSTPSPEHHISGLNVLDSLLFIVCHDDRIQIYSTKTGKHVQDLRLQNTHDIGCLEAVNTHTLVATEEATLYIISLSKDGTAARRVVKRTLPYAPSDITVSTTGELILTDPIHKSMQVFDKDFQRVEKIALPHADSEYPHCVVKMENGFAVADANNTIAVTDKSGSQYAYIYGGSDHLSEPQHVVRDLMGRLLVCDSGNNRIQLLDSKAKFLSNILSAEHGLQYPSRLFLDSETGLLYVGQRDAVNIYEYKYEPNQARCMNLTLQLTQLPSQ